MSVDRQGRPRLGEVRRDKRHVLQIGVLESERLEDLEECLAVGVVSTSSGNPNIAQLYRTMREYWYSLSASERKRFVKSLEKEKYDYPNVVMKRTKKK